MKITPFAHPKLWPPKQHQDSIQEQLAHAVRAFVIEQIEKTFEVRAKKHNANLDRL